MTSIEVVTVLVFVAGLIYAALVAKRNLTYRKQLRKEAAEKAANSARLAFLNTNLLLKTLGDQSTVNSLIEFERGKLGNLPLEELMEAAIQRWEQDNR